METQEEFNDIKLIHIRFALKLLFPTYGFQKDKIFESVRHLKKYPKILKVGIIHQRTNTALEFMHRTLAEYLVAEYFFTKLQNEEIEKTDELCCGSVPILNLILDCTWSFFVHSVVVFFLDSFFTNTGISEELVSQVTPFCASIRPTNLQFIFCNCCRHDLYHIFSLLKQALLKCSECRIRESLTARNTSELFLICIVNSNTRLFQSCIQLFTEPHNYNNQFPQSTTNSEHAMLLRWAVNYVNYEAVEYFADRIPLKGQNILLECVKYSYYHDSDILKREDILHLLLNKDPRLVHETQNILVSTHIHLKLIKILVKFGAKMTNEGIHGENCALHAAQYMTPVHYYEFIQFVLHDCKAEYLFHEKGKWKDDVRVIIREFEHLPETLELLIKIPSIDINMKDECNENLLFSAARGNKLNTLKKLVDCGMDFNAKGKRNGSLLHVAAECGGVEMVQYILLSLKLDPNSHDTNQETPLHYVFKYDVNLSVIEILVKNGANVQAKNLQGQTLLHLFAKHFLYPSAPNEEIVKYFVGNGLRINERDKKGNTPLHLCRYKEVMKCMVEMGADINAKNNDGITPLHSNPELELWQSSRISGSGSSELQKCGIM